MGIEEHNQGQIQKKKMSQTYKNIFREAKGYDALKPTEILSEGKRL